MSKKHEREQRILERLHQENRQLKQEVKSLRNSIRKLNKGYHKLEEDDKIEKKDIPVEAKKCWDCTIGNYNLVIIMNRRFRRCDNCGKTGKVSLI